MSKLTRQLEQVFEERMTALLLGVEAAVAESLAEARREVAAKLNQSVRRMRTARDESQWAAALVEAAEGFCDRAVLFKIHGNTMNMIAARGVDGTVADVALSSAPAFASAVESKDTVIAIRTVGEMSPAIASLVGIADSQKCYLFPVLSREGAAAVLYTDAAEHSVDSGALESLATVAGALVHIADNPPDIQLQAQRFARVQVADIRLYKSEEVKNGRIARDLYASLRTEIDSARESYQRDFLSGPDNMVDYLHQELVRTLANNDAELLGPGYPGPLA